MFKIKTNKNTTEIRTNRGLVFILRKGHFEFVDLDYCRIFEKTKKTNWTLTAEGFLKHFKTKKAAVQFIVDQEIKINKGGDNV